MRSVSAGAGRLAVEVIRQNRTIAAILGGLVVVVVLVLVSRGGDSDAGPSVPADATTPGTATTTAATPQAPAEAFQRPDVRTLKCDTLLPNDAIKAALGNPSSWGTTALAEDCSIDTDDSDATLQIAPGSPADFEPGFTIFGVPGVPVEGVGDLALWFGGSDAEGGGSVGAIVVAAESELGALVFRIAVGRPDLDSDAQLEIAKDLALAALPRFPAVRLTTEAEPTPIPVTINIESEPVDRSNLSYVDNLLAREADGEWTRSEGLIATLQLLVGEREAAEVLRDGPVLDTFGSGLARLAHEYLAADPDGEDAAEIDRLLAIVAPRPAPLATAASTRLARGQLAITSDSQQPSPDCHVGFPNFDDTCFVTTDLGGGYRVHRPAIGAGETWAGWRGGGNSLELGVAGMARVLASLPGDKPLVDVWPAPGAQTLHLLEDRSCEVYLGESLDQLRFPGAQYLEQAVAAEVARCYVSLNISDAAYSATRWWEDALVIYLSDVAFPTASLEADILTLPGRLAGMEFSSGFRNRSQSNLAYFESITTGNPQLAVSAATAMALTGLEAVPRIDEQLHAVAQELSDGIFFDVDGLHPYQPPATEEVASAATVYTTTFRPFTTHRFDFRVPSGMHACMSYEGPGAPDVRVSWRIGPPGAAAGGPDWSSDLPATLDGRATFVMTAINSQEFDLVVDRLTDDPADCEEQEESTVPAPGPPCGGCPRTSFYSDWEIPRTN